MSDRIDTRELSFKDLRSKITVYTEDATVTGYLLNMGTDLEYMGNGALAGGGVWIEVGNMNVPLGPGSTFTREESH